MTIGLFNKIRQISQASQASVGKTSLYTSWSLLSGGSRMAPPSSCPHFHISLADLVGACPLHAPPKGPDSFVLTYKIFETSPPQESTSPPTRSTPPPTGNSGSATAYFPKNGHVVIWCPPPLAGNLGSVTAIKT